MSAGFDSTTGSNAQQSFGFGKIEVSSDALVILKATRTTDETCVTDQLVFSKIQKLLNPNSIMVFSKILGIHLVFGFLSLSICHQFGINPFNTERSLADWMMNVGGHHLCMIGCGILFVGLSILAAGMFLRIEEINALKRTQYLQTLVLGPISLGIFVSFGAELAIGIALLWLAGGLVGGVAATQTIFKIRQA